MWEGGPGGPGVVRGVCAGAGGERNRWEAWAEDSAGWGAVISKIRFVSRMVSGGLTRPERCHWKEELDWRRVVLCEAA